MHGPKNAAELEAALAEHGSLAAAGRACGVARTTLAARASKWGVKTPFSPGGVSTPIVPTRTAEPAELLAAAVRIERASAEVRSLRAQLRIAAKHENVIEDIRDLLAPVIASSVLAAPKAPKLKPRDHKPVTFVWHLNDLHWGELVEAENMNGVNAYNPDIAAARLQYTVDTILTLADNYAGRHGVDELVIAINGDTIGGAIHPDSAEYYARVGRQALDASLVISQIVWELASHFPKVRLLGTVGNHPRSTTRMPTGTARVETSWEWLLHEQTAALLANAPNVSFEMARGYVLQTTIGPSEWAFSHGDAAKGGGGALGIPAYGLKRQHDATREWSMVLAQLEGAAVSDIIKHTRYGHFHTYLMWQAGAADICLGPSPKGVDPFVKDVLGKYSPPQFLLEVVHPEHDIIAQHLIDLAHIQDGSDDCRYVWNPKGELGMAVDVMRARLNS